MDALYGLTEPYDEGTLAVGDQQTIHWSQSGNPEGKPVVILIDDLEQLRASLGIDRWMVWGGSPMDFPVNLAAEISRLGGEVDLFVGTDDGQAGSSMNAWTTASTARLAAEVVSKP